MKESFRDDYPKQDFTCVHCGHRNTIMAYPKLDVTMLRGRLAEALTRLDTLSRAPEINERLRKAIRLAIIHIKGKCEKFSEREATSVVCQLREALQNEAVCEHSRPEVTQKELADSIRGQLSYNTGLADDIAAGIIDRFAIRRKP